MEYGIDRSMNGMTYDGLQMYDANHLNTVSKNATVVVTLDKNERPIVELLHNTGYENVVTLKEIMGLEENE